jgi:hypothetical protein
LSADQALLTAPAPPDPPPRSADTGEGRRPAQNKLFVYGGAGAAVVAVLSLGILLGQSGKDEATAEAAASASAAAEKKAAAVKEEEDEKRKKEAKKEEEKKEEAKTEASASPSPSASVASKKGPPGPPSDKKTTTPTPTSTATGTPSEPKKEETGPAVGTAPFSVSAAQVELTKAAGSAPSCKKPDGPTGSGKVTVTFATSGRVTSANVAGPPFAGTPVGGCVAGVFRRAKVPPFSGTSVTVSKSFSIK